MNMEWVVVITIVAAVGFIVLVLKNRPDEVDEPCPPCRGTGIEHSAMGTTYHVRCGSCGGSGHA